MRRLPPAGLVRIALLAAAAALPVPLHGVGGIPAARAGDGAISGTKVDVSAYFAYDETDANLAENGPWHGLFTEVSKLLWNATQGQLQLGTVTVFRNCPESLDRADFIVMNDNSGARANVFGLGTLGTHIWISQTHRSTSGANIGQLGCVHEMGHYVFGLYDEYQGEKRTNNAAQTILEQGVRDDALVCVADGTNAKCCIMDGGTTVPTKNQRTEFCTKTSDGFAGTSHRSGAVSGGFLWFNDQAIQNSNESCWETIARRRALTQPAAEPSSALPAGHQAVVWDVVDCKQRVVLCIDRSGSMSVEGRLGAAQSAARLFTYFVDLRRQKDTGSGIVTIPGDDLGVTAFDNLTYVPYSLQEMVDAAGPAAARASINTLTPGGATSIGGGLRVSLTELLRFPKRVSGEAILLLSDGQHNSGEDPSTVVPDLIARKVRVFTVALGSDADATLLQSIAASTGGQFFFSATGAGLAEIFLALQARTRGGALVFEPGEQTIAAGATQQRDVPLDSFTEQANFVLSTDEPGLTFELRRPDGSSVTPPTVDPNVQYLSAEGALSYRVDQPATGTWRAVVGAPAGGSDADLSASSGSAITDFATTTSMINVPGGFTVSQVAVNVDITHTFIGDLSVALTSPEGTVVTLHANSGGGADNLVGNYPGTLTPAGSLSAFAGEAAAGNWTLSVTDGVGGDTGTLNSWGLSFSHGIVGSASYKLSVFGSGSQIAVTPSVAEPDVAFPDPAVLRVTVVAGDAVAGAEVTGSVETPDGDVIPMTLLDDGSAESGDGEADDGTYSGRFFSYTSDGTYRASILVRNVDGFAATALVERSEDDPNRVEGAPIAPFERIATQEFRVTGVPPTKIYVLRVDAAKAVLGRGTGDSLSLKGRLNAARGTIDPSTDDVTFEFGAFSTTIPAGGMVRKGTRDAYTFADATRTAVLDLYRRGSSQGRFSLVVKKTDVDSLVDVTAPVPVRLDAGFFDDTVSLVMSPNPDPATGGGYRIGPTNVTPAQFYVDVLTLKRNPAKPDADSLVGAFRLPGAVFVDPSQDFSLGLGPVTLTMPGGTMVATGAIAKGTVDLAPGKLTVIYDGAKHVLRVTAKGVDLSAVPTTVPLAVTNGITTFRQVIALTPVGPALVY